MRKIRILNNLMRKIQADEMSHVFSSIYLFSDISLFVTLFISTIHIYKGWFMSIFLRKFSEVESNKEVYTV